MWFALKGMKAKLQEKWEKTKVEGQQKIQKNSYFSDRYFHIQMIWRSCITS